MIRHEHIRVHCAAAPIRSFGEAFKIKTPIDIPEKTSSTIYPALYDVQRNTGKLYARRTWHVSCWRRGSTPSTTSMSGKRWTAVSRKLL
jgi:hypothetical protein